MLLAMAVSIFVAAQPSIPRNAAFWVMIPLVLLLRAAVGIYDRLFARGERALEYNAEEFDDYDE